MDYSETKYLYVITDRDHVLERDPWGFHITIAVNYLGQANGRCYLKSSPTELTVAIL